MANRFAVATGNWSNPAIWNGGTLPTSADDVYSNNFTVTIDQDVTVLSIRNTAQSPAVAGGGFVVSGSYTISATSGGFILGTANLITYNSSLGTTVTLNGYVNCTVVNNFNLTAIVFNGAGTLNVNGDIQASNSPSTSNRRGVDVNGNGILNVVGNLLFTYSSLAIRITGTGSVTNITGNVGTTALNTSTTNAQNQMINIGTAATLNVTGIVYGGGGGGNNGSIGIAANNAVVNVTGSVIAGHVNGYGIFSSAVSTINVIGILSASRVASFETQAIFNSVTTAINLLSGPFVSAPYGTTPFFCFRMNYIPTIGSYFEFRDNSTNGALSPGPIAPAARLVSPDTVVDSPIPANVRNGITYALGSLTGTLAVPAPGSVALGVPTDNTVGTAVLTPAAVWDYATANITDVNSIGARLKNVSTVDTTGEQLEAFLNG